MNIVAKFHNFGRLLKIRFKRSDILWNCCLFPRRGAKTTLPSVRSKQLNTPCIGWHEIFISESPNFYCQHESQSFRIYCSISWQFSLLLHYHWLYDTTNFYKLQNAQWIEEIQCAQNILVFFLMCELNVTVKLYRAACRLMLTHISSQIRTIRFPTLCLTLILLTWNIR